MREVTGAEADVRALFEPRSVAVVGASSRPGALAWWPLQLLRGSGFEGKVYAVNPNREEIDGVRCYPSVADLPEAADLAIVTLNAELTPEAVAACHERGVRAVVLPTQGLGELSEEGKRKEREMISLVEPGRFRIVGANTDGIGNIANGAIASIQPLFQERIEPGPVAVATQSGATAASLLARLKREGIGCRLYASAGNETDLGLADYMSAMVQDPEVEVVLSFVEAIRDPQAFLAVAELAAELGKPIGLIKVGRSEEGARRAAAHTGALAGADELYDAIFRSAAVLRVGELGELVAIAKLAIGGRAPAGRGIGVISVSGGQAGAIADKAAQLGVPVPPISPATQAALDEALTFGSAFNPCDLTGAVATEFDLAARVYSAFSAEPGLETIVYARKLLTGEAGVTAARNLAAAASEPGATPLAVYAMDGDVGGPEREAYDGAGIPVFSSLHELLIAIERLGGWREAAAAAAERARGVPRIVPPRPAPDLRPGRNGIVPEEVAKQLLAEYGVPVAAERLATTAEEAVAAAAEIGFPVAMKIVSARIPHKTEAGGVALGVADAEGVAAAFAQLLDNARAYLGEEGGVDGVLVQEQVPPGVEMIAGIKVDPSFGPFVLLGTGGVEAELHGDVALRPAPVTLDEVEGMIDELRGRALLTGFRGAPTADRAALRDAVARLSELAVDLRERLAEADLNPIVVLPEGRGVRAVDALLIAR